MTTKRVPLPTGPLYKNGDDEPVTITMLNGNIMQLSDALAGASTMLECIPDDTDICPQRLMLQLAFDYMNVVLGRLLPIEGYADDEPKVKHIKEAAE